MNLNHIIGSHRCLKLLAAAALAVSSHAASAAVLMDNFNDNAISANWLSFNHGTTKVKETGGRLCFRSNSDTAGLRRARYASNGWTYRGDKSHTITFNYKLNVPGLSGSESAAVGVWVEEPDDASALEVLVFQNANGWFVELELFVGGNSALREVKPINSGSGSVEIRYSEPNDRMTVKVDGQTKITVPEINGDYGEFDLDVELFGWSKKTSFAWNKAWIDNFRLSGVID